MSHEPPGPGSAQTERPGTPLPDASWKVSKVLPTGVSTGLISGGSPFRLRTGFGPPQASTEVKAPPQPRAGAEGSFCAFISVLGPLIKVPGGGYSGQESGGLECGPINPKTGLVNTNPTRGGSLEQPEGETETWQTFDVGVVAYPPSVDRVRLRFAGGGSTVSRCDECPPRFARRAGNRSATTAAWTRWKGSRGAGLWRACISWSAATQ